MRTLEILWIVLFRFPLVPRIWAVLLIAVNACCLLFLDTVYGQFNLAATLAAVAVMAVIHAKLGFVRLLGIGHVFWIPMLVWFLFHLPEPSESPMLYRWVIVLFVFNSISLIIDAVDVFRFIRGERKPHFTW